MLFNLYESSPYDYLDDVDEFEDEFVCPICHSPVTSDGVEYEAYNIKCEQCRRYVCSDCIQEINGVDYCDACLKEYDITESSPYDKLDDTDEFYDDVVDDFLNNVLQFRRYGSMYCITRNHDTIGLLTFWIRDGIVEEQSRGTTQKIGKISDPVAFPELGGWTWEDLIHAYIDEIHPSHYGSTGLFHESSPYDKLDDTDEFSDEGQNQAFYRVTKIYRIDDNNAILDVDWPDGTGNSLLYISDDMACDEDLNAGYFDPSDGDYTEMLVDTKAGQQQIDEIPDEVLDRLPGMKEAVSQYRVPPLRESSPYDELDDADEFVNDDYDFIWMLISAVKPNMSCDDLIANAGEVLLDAGYSIGNFEIGQRNENGAFYNRLVGYMEVNGLNIGQGKTFEGHDVEIEISPAS